MTRTRRFWKAARDGGLALAGIGAIALAVFTWVHEPKDRPVRLRMTAGRAAGERHRIAEILAREASRRAITIGLVETAGSEEALGELAAGRLDVALVQGGLDLADRPDLRQVATLHVEPLHLLVKEELLAEVSAHLSALRGKVVGLGERGSGTHRLATEVMAFAGLRPGTTETPGDFIASTASYADLRREADRGKLPDAVFMVSTLPSPIARGLVTRHRYRLVALPFFEAFNLGALDQDPNPPRPAGEPTARIERRHVYSAQIPAFTYGIEPAVPERPVETIGTRLLILARDDVPVRTIYRLLDVVFGPPFSRALQPPLDPRQLDLPPELPWHEGTIAYLRRNAPMIAGDVVDLFEKELSIIGGVLTGLFFLGQWVRRRYRRRRDLSFESYIRSVTSVEQRAMVLERAPTLDLGALLNLQDELSRLKREALERFADGTLEGEELMSGFLTHVSDTRDYLTRMILHEREVLEKQARHSGRESAALWQEAIADGEPATYDD